MTNKYTDKEIEQFFKKFNELPEYFELEKVHQLVNNPDAVARLSGKSFIKPFKFIIMTTIIVTLSTTLFVWLWPFQKDEIQKPKDKYIASVSSTSLQQEPAKASKQLSGITTTKKQEKVEPQILKQEPNTVSVKDTAIISNKPASCNCNWPEDTMLNKYDMFVYLTPEEFKKIGVLVNGDSLYYHNITPDEKNTMDIISSRNWNPHTKEYRENKWITNKKYYLIYTSDTSCITYRWRDPFYNEIDTLLPVLYKDYIYWFTSNSSIFNDLPSKYKHLEATLNNLKCLKKKFPNKKLVNYWEEKRNVVLDSISYIELPKDKLEKIGIEFFKDSISIINDRWGGGSFYMGPFSLATGETNFDTTLNLLNPLPVIITDEKGLKQNYFGGTNSKNSYKSMFDMLVPVKIDLSKYILTRDYSLIFWFYPSKEFIEALPDNIRGTIKSESESILKGVSIGASSCTYFEACKSTLFLPDLKVYPNPARQMATVEFSTDKELSGTISLVNISGALVKQLCSLRNFKGQNKIDVNLEGIPSGIYLISIFSDKGFKTQRLIVTH
jgi:hypothetical protein